MAAHILYVSGTLFDLYPNKALPLTELPGFFFSMPSAAPRPCRHAGCSSLVRDGSGYCGVHQADKKLGTFADPRRGSRQSRGYGAAWDKVRKIVLARDKGLCQECLRRSQYRLAAVVDHKIPKFEGGTDEEENLQALCKACHDAKTASESKRGRG